MAVISPDLQLLAAVSDDQIQIPEVLLSEREESLKFSELENSEVTKIVLYYSKEILKINNALVGLFDVIKTLRDQIVILENQLLNKEYPENETTN